MYEGKEVVAIILPIVLAIAGVFIGLIGIVYGDLRKRITDHDGDFDKVDEKFDKIQEELLSMHRDFATKADIKEIKNDIKLILKTLMGGQK